MDRAGFVAWARGAIAAAIISALILGCRGQQAIGTRSRPREYGPERASVPILDDVAHRYVHAALALGERDPDSIDFSVAPEVVREAVRRSYPSLDEIDREVGSALKKLEELPSDQEKKQQQRAAFLHVQLQSVLVRTAMLRGKTLEFDREARALFGENRMADTSAADRERSRAQIATLLPSNPRKGTRGGPTLAAEYAAFDHRFVVPPSRVADVLHAALVSCRAQTTAFLKLPAGESVELTFVRNQPWNAFSRYRGQAHSTIAVNLDFPMTVDRALELACHEGYPGHHVFNSLRDSDVAKQRNLPELEVQLTFSPQSYVSESAAAFAPRLAFTEAERIRVERDILFPLAGLDGRLAARYVVVNDLVRHLETAEPAIAHDYLDGGLEFVRAEDELARQMLMEHADATLLYLNEYRTYMLAYTDGPRRVAAYVDSSKSKSEVQGPEVQGDRSAQWRRYESLMRTLQFAF